jgi:hypothetical protein
MRTAPVRLGQRGGLRLLEEMEQRKHLELEALRAEINAGRNSGAPKSADEVFDRLEGKYAALGQNQGIDAPDVSPLAEPDLESVGDYIARDNPRRALSFVQELRAQCSRIGVMPGLPASRTGRSYDSAPMATRSSSSTRWISA